jgi:hypothetical protein
MLDYHGKGDMQIVPNSQGNTDKTKNNHELPGQLFAPTGSVVEKISHDDMCYYGHQHPDQAEGSDYFKYHAYSPDYFFIQIQRIPPVIKQTMKFNYRPLCRINPDTFLDNSDLDRAACSFPSITTKL